MLVAETHIPLGGIGSYDGWGLVDLALVVLAFLSACIGIVVRFSFVHKELRRANDEQRSDALKRCSTLLLASSVLGFFPFVLFLLLENFSHPMLISAWTLPLGILFLIHVIMIAFSYTTLSHKNRPFL